MNLAELTDLELAEKVLDLAGPHIAIPARNPPCIERGARFELEAFFRELRQAWRLFPRNDGGLERELEARMRFEGSRGPL